jgi:hypothetical protein
VGDSVEPLLHLLGLSQRFRCLNDITRVVCTWSPARLPGYQHPLQNPRNGWLDAGEALSAVILLTINLPRAMDLQALR